MVQNLSFRTEKNSMQTYNKKTKRTGAQNRRDLGIIHSQLKSKLSVSYPCKSTKGNSGINLAERYV